MPPEVEPVPSPTGWGDDARQYLEAHGLVAQVPTIRASDYQSALSCPFRYYLTRRLGLSSQLYYSSALSRGSWFHERMRLGWTENTGVNQGMLELLEARFEELTEACRQCGVGEDARQAMLEREDDDMRMACAWFEAMLTVPIGDGPCLRDRLDAPHWRLLGQELRVHVPYDGQHGQMLLVCQFDALLYHTEQNTVWGFDPKTTAAPTITRLAVCPIEFACQHYSYIAKTLLEQGVLQERYGLPADCTFGGFIHAAVLKPTINLSSNDRDYEEYEHTLASGPRRGQVELRRNYRGEPRYCNYFERVHRWYHAVAEYEDKQPERVDAPAVNLSRTYASSFDDPNWVEQYHNRLALITKYARMRPLPKNFPMTATGLIRGSTLDPLHVFYLNHPREWPALVEQNNLMKTWRDEDLHARIQEADELDP